MHIMLYSVGANRGQLLSDGVWEANGSLDMMCTIRTDLLRFLGYRH